MAKQTLVIAPARRPCATNASSKQRDASASALRGDAVQAIRRDQRKVYQQAIDRAENEGWANLAHAAITKAPDGMVHWQQPCSRRSTLGPHLDTGAATGQTQ